ncbi:MAG: MBL fold metallo-hydrolase [Bacteroidia bacterium]|nr:MBL fold metallo-hydrolase [Bacteroidia bacterium]
MQVQFLGTGGAFDYEYGNSAVWIRFRGYNVLLDCGYSVYDRLRKDNLADGVDYILITHCHDDHVGSLSSLILHQTFLSSPARRATILVPDETFHQHLYQFIQFSLLSPDKYINFQPLSALPGISAINTSGRHVEGMPSYGYILEDEDEIMVYSGDIGDPNFIFDQIRHLNHKPMRVFHEMSIEESDGIHTNYQALARHLADFTIYAYHLDPRTIPADNEVPLVINFPDFLR